MTKKYFLQKYYVDNKYKSVYNQIIKIKKGVK